MLIVSKPKDLLSHINYDLGYGEWILVDQKKIDEKEKLLSGEKQKEIYKEMKKIFPDAGLMEVKIEDE